MITHVKIWWGASVNSWLETLIHSEKRHLTKNLIIYWRRNSWNKSWNVIFFKKKKKNACNPGNSSYFPGYNFHLPGPGHGIEACRVGGPQRWRRLLPCRSTWPHQAEARDRQGRPRWRCVPAWCSDPQARAVLGLQEACRGRPGEWLTALLQPEPGAHLQTQSATFFQMLADQGRVRPPLSPACSQTHCRDQRVQSIQGSFPRPEIRETREPAHHDHLHPRIGWGPAKRGSGLGLLRILSMLRTAGRSGPFSRGL